jgi:hypothetical protein
LHHCWITPSILANPRNDKDEELFNRIKQEVLARLGRPVDQATLDAVLRKVLAAL